MKVFSKAKFIESDGYYAYLECKSWVDKCDGKYVINGEVEGYISDNDWEVEMQDYKKAKNKPNKG